MKNLGETPLVLLAALSIARSSDQSRIQEYQAEAPKTILELQQFRQLSSIRILPRDGKERAATLINLNPAVNAWYLLKVNGGSSELAYHLENPSPRTRKLLLDEKVPSGLIILEGDRRYSCELFGSSNALDQAKSSIFYPLCDGRIYVRNAVAGHRTTLEAATEFLREHIWGGEKIIDLGHIIMGDAHRQTGKIQQQPQPKPGGAQEDLLPALIDRQYADRSLSATELGIDIEGPERTSLAPGAWYPAEGNPGIFVSILQPSLIDPAILESRAALNRMEKVEASALCYLVAFDLDRFELGYALGTDHPKVGWSDRVQDRMKNPALPGPDGIGSIGPLVATGLVDPMAAAKVVATFTAGFKRAHGAFRYGDLALKNHGSHYGFIENGVVFSKLQPGLATIFVLSDGSIGMKTWTEADNGLLANIRHARQNGVPLIESAVPGPLVNRWGEGNWSGSESGALRTMRSGVALQKNRGKRFLIYAVFSDATPSTMARVFQAYGCDYAMLLDMNALEHTYLAVYRRSGSQMFVDHMLKGMSVLEKSSAAGEIVPRFLGYADNRDFFYILRRNEGKP